MVLTADDKSKYNDLMSKMRPDFEEFKKRWANRGAEARVARHQAKLASGHKTWRQMKGAELMIHEIKHPGNRPFMWGFFTVGVFALYVQSTFTDETRKTSEYYQTFHAKDKH